MKNQFFSTSLNFHFNLKRESKNTSPCTILVCYSFNHKQFKVNTRLKAFRKLWDAKNNEAIISLNLSNLDNKNNRILNERLEIIKKQLKELKNNISDNPHILESLNENVRNIVQGGDKTKNSAITLIRKAFEILYSQETTTKKQYYYQLNVFFNFLKNEIKNDDIESLNQETLNNFKEFLIKNGQATKTINGNCSLIRHIINFLAMHTDFKKYSIQKVEYISIRNTIKPLENKKVLLLESEIETLINLRLENRNESLIRWIFIMACFSGQRFSDMKAVFRTPLKKELEKEEEIIINTKKERTQAIVTYTPLMKQIRKNCPELQHEWVLLKDFNIIIKNIAQKANLNRIVRFSEARASNIIIEKEKPLHELISSHFARVYFINHEIMNNWDVNKLYLRTGHVNSKMIETTYNRVDGDMKKQLIEEEKKKLKKK